MAEPIVRSNKATFSACVTGLVTAASATDVFIIQGANGRRIEIDRIEITGTGTATAVPVSVIRRNSAASNGTPAAITPVAFDSRVSIVSAALVNSYTANPTVGNAVGTLWVGRLRLQAAGGSAPPTLIVDSAQLNSGAMALNSASEWLAINFGSTSITSPLIEIFVRWTETYLVDGING
jgi:hypothetical protein